MWTDPSSRQSGFQRAVPRQEGHAAIVRHRRWVTYSYILTAFLQYSTGILKNLYVHASTEYLKCPTFATYPRWCTTVLAATIFCYIVYANKCTLCFVIVFTINWRAQSKKKTRACALIVAARASKCSRHNPRSKRISLGSNRRHLDSPRVGPQELPDDQEDKVCLLVPLVDLGNNRTTAQSGLIRPYHGQFCPKFLRHILNIKHTPPSVWTTVDNKYTVSPASSPSLGLTQARNCGTFPTVKRCCT